MRMMIYKLQYCVRRVARISLIVLCIGVLLRGDVANALTYDPCKDQPQTSATGLSCEQKRAFNIGAYQYNVGVGQCSVDGSTQTTSVTMPADATAEDKIAQTFMVGFDAGTPKETITKVATDFKIGGIYLTGTKDAVGAGFTKEYFDSLGTAAKVPLAVASDEEGGQVKRYSYTSDFPSAKAMGAMTEAQVTAIGTSVGKQLSDNGVTIDLAPVLDIDNGKNDGVISGLERAWSSDPATITTKAGAFAKGLSTSGITPVYKHFPGLGLATGAQGNNTDAAKATSPDIASLKAKDLIPYSKLIGQYGAPVMLSNEYVTGVDATLPASESAGVVNLLRNDYKFNGLIMTDDLKPASTYDGLGGLPNSVAAAEKAGVNMPLFSFTSEADLTAAIAAVKAAASADQISTSVSKIIALKGGSDANTVAPTNDGSANAGCCSQGGTTQVSGDDNVATVLNFLQKPAPEGLGLNFNAALGVTANLQRESNINPASVGGPAHGIAQWQNYPPYSSTGRWQRLQDFATAAGKDWTDFGLQLDYLKKEATEGFPGLIEALNSAPDAKTAADIWFTKFEGASEQYKSDNYEKLDDLQKKYNSGSPQAIGAGSTASGSSSCGDSTNGFTGDAGDGKVVNCPTDTSVKCIKSIYYSQVSGPWSSQPFVDCGTIAECGCGVTAAAMAIATLTNDPKVTPGSLMADWTSNKLASKNGTSWDSAAWSAVGQKYGVTVTNISAHTSLGMSDAEIQKIIDAINAGGLVVVAGKGSSPFTSGGHFVMLRGYDSTKKEFLVSNPGRNIDRPEATDQPITSDPLKAYGEGAWIFSK